MDTLKTHLQQNCLLIVGVNIFGNGFGINVGIDRLVITPQCYAWFSGER